MAKTPSSELFSTLKGYFNQLTEGERTPTEVASALNDWARESAESVKAKIAEEVEATVAKMGFIKREEYDELLARVAELESKKAKKPATSSKASVKKSAASKSTKANSTKKSAAKKASK
jgi:BMFP domain-containing protein YqiC